MPIQGIRATKVRVPTEQDEWMVIKDDCPSWIVEEAKSVVTNRLQTKLFGMSRELGGRDALNDWFELNDPTPKEEGEEPEPEEETNERDTVDMPTLCNWMVASWSYAEHDGKAIRVSVDNIQSLDDATRNWLYDHVWGKIRPDSEGN